MPLKMSGLLLMSLGRRRFYHSGEALKMMNYANKVNPGMASFIQDHKLWDVIFSYSKKQHFIEKSVLIEPQVAESIVSNIVEKSMTTPNAKFIDITGGLGLVSSAMHKRQKYQRVFVAEERLIEALRMTASELEGPDGLVVIKKNLLNDKHLVHILRTKHLIHQDRFWELEHPQMTVFGIVSHASIKRLTYSLKQYHVALSENDVITNLYNFGRPEFFFLISQRTLIHISAKPGQNMIRNASNVLFQLLFEMEVVSTHPREAFLPWKNHFNKRTPAYEKLFPELESQFYLVLCRPRIIQDIFSPSTVSYLPFFLRAILGKRKTKVYDRINNFIPNISESLQAESGISANRLTGFLSNDEIVTLFNLIVKHPNFHGSTFRGAALDYEEESSNLDITPKVMTDVYDAQRKTLLTSGSFKWDSDSFDK